jgi:hypothetical protein
LGWLFLPAFILGQAIKVEVSQNADGNWQLLRGGAPYYIRGAGGSTQLDKLIAIGGNSIRTWSTDNAKEVLDAAHAKGLTVMMGLWVQHERHGFDYDNQEKVRLQLEGFRKVVMEIKDHPALLLWGVGNEVDLFYSNTKVWNAVNDIAAMIKELDPMHPTCTVTAGLDKEEVKLIKENAPAIDIYGINTYGDLGAVKDNLRKFGWTGPYIISEWGPNGHWEVAKTKWGAPVEQSSTEKANSYQERYEKYIAGDSGMCIGSYVFLWGQKQETTSTWYGLFSEKGESCEALDRLQKIWTGQAPENACPSLDSCRVNGMVKGDYITIQAGDIFSAQAYANDNDNDRLKYTWQLVPESKDIKSGGDAESAPLPVSGVIRKKKAGYCELRAPSEEGPYRLFLYITDNNNHYAYTNIPLYIVRRDPSREMPKAVSFKKISLE